MVPIKILLDSCSQQMFVSQKIVKRLELTPREIIMNIKAFGNSHSKDMWLKEYQIVLRRMDKNSNIKAFAIPSICAPISQQNVKLAK